MSTWRLLILLLAAALLSAWIYRAVRPTAHPGEVRAGHVPGAYARDLVSRRYDRTGRLVQVLEARRLTRYADDGRTWLEAPRLRLLAGTGPHWTAAADRALVSPDGARILLRDRVRIQRLPGAGRPPGLFTTSSLLVFPRRNEAETDRPVRWQTPDLTVTAVGMRAWLDRDELELLSRVHARLAPRRREEAG
ncbi:MAG: LPS export ABC transporter periplasmic protein LptC [Gammaproteobacteria bacterium]|nr:MAG: LPS export ABC transporter periplasmic protein LptC [Gammaproteobacteria bacterium]